MVKYILKHKKNNKYIYKFDINTNVLYTDDINRAYIFNTKKEAEIMQDKTIEIVLKINLEIRK